MAITPLKHVSVISGVGVGGGSLVYGNTLYVPTANEFFEHEQWGALAEWRAVLAPHFATAQRMLGVTTYVGDGPSEAMMHKIAEELGVPTRFTPPGSACSSVCRDGACPTHTSTARARSDPDASDAVSACSAAATTPRTRS